MNDTPLPRKGDCVVLTVEQFGVLLRRVHDDGYQLIGPTVRDGAITYGEIDGIDDLPAGWQDTQEPASCRLQRRGDNALFGYTVGPNSWKQFLFVPNLLFWRAHCEGKEFKIDQNVTAPPRVAFLGVRSCDLHAIAVQDRVFTKGPVADPDYTARRNAALILAVNCGRAGGTCFCVSMGTGPRALDGFDLAFTELLDTDHLFLAEVGSARGAAVLAAAEWRPASDVERARGDQIVDGAARTMGRRMDTTDIRDLLYASYEHTRWDDTARRCLACANCALVCPTCFCSTVEDTTDLTGQQAERSRRWDTCYSPDHSYLHGTSVRTSIKARYRQWLTHKLATWIDQFGTSGCVGCGRCITWCPAAIDLTEEIRAIRGSPVGTPATAEVAPDGNT